MPRRNLWIDGVNSVVAAKLILDLDPGADLLHCDLGESVHPDSHRFINDVEQWLGKEVIRLKSKKYNVIDDVFDARGYLSGINGAPCTGEMKFAPRLDYQLPSDIHFWGYTADKADAKRFTNMQANFPELNQRAPLVEMGITKKDSHSMLAGWGIKRPIVYDLGMPNGNCLGCVKATSPNYWALIRKEFPEVFAKRVEQSHKFGTDGVRLTRIKGERIFIDEIPADWPTKTRGNMGGCGFHCQARMAV